MPPVIDVDPDQYEAASRSLGNHVASILARAFNDLIRGLAATGAMAGHDRAGRAWGQAYDRAGPQALGAIAMVERATVKVATLLQRTGFNHAEAESMSDAQRRAQALDVATYSCPPRMLSTCGLLPAAAGGSGDYPDGWDLIRSTVGFEWPDGHPGRLRSAATAWRTAGRTISSLTIYVDEAIAAIQCQQSPEVPDAVAVCSGLRTHLAAAAKACTNLASACADLASSIDTAHHKAIHALKILVAISAGTQVAGAIGAIFSFGVSEVVAQTAEAAEVATVASEVSAYLAVFSTEAGAAVLVVSGVDSEVLAVSRMLQPVLATEIVTAEASAVPAIAISAAGTAEIVAETRLAVAAGVERVDLRAAEDAGGHTIAKHVGKTDAELIARDVQQASTFSDLNIAETCTAKNLVDNGAEVTAWLAGNDPRLTIRTPVSSTSGRIYVRQLQAFRPPQVVVTVLDRTPTGFLVRTSYLN